MKISYRTLLTGNGRGGAPVRELPGLVHQVHQSRCITPNDEYSSDQEEGLQSTVKTAEPEEEPRCDSMSREALTYALASVGMTHTAAPTKAEKWFESRIIDIVWRSMSGEDQSVNYARFQAHMSLLLDPAALKAVQRKCEASGELSQDGLSRDFLDIAPELTRRYNFYLATRDL